MMHRYTLPLVALLLLAAWPTSDACAVTCAAAPVLSPASLPITNQALACGATNDLNSTNVPGTLCGSGANAGYKNGNEALYQFTPTVSGSYTFSMAGQTWSSIQVWQGCPTSGGTCVYGNGGILAGLTINATLTAGVLYYIWFDTWPTPASPCPGTFSITPPVPPPTNGTPCASSATPLVLTCGGGMYTNAGAGNSNTAPVPTCGNYIAGSQDVWFSFVAGPYGQVNLQSSAGTLTDGAMAVYSAPSCSGPFTQVACDDDSGPGLMPQLNLNGLTPGQTYYVRFWGYGTATGTFNLCVQGVASVPPGGCVYMLNLFDSFGDGWGSSNVGVSINGGPFTYYTVTGSSNFVAIPATPGTLIVLTYNNSGPFQGENSYTLTLGAGSIFNSGSPPAAGTSYAGTLTCNPPPSPPEDCVGSITICSGQSFNNNTNNTGNVADLTLATAGCLLNTERQGTWYNFTISSGGQVAFTINPANPADDYDFAIWGPFPPGSTPGSICPPLTAPLRCSYAAPSGATGLNYTATDLSEDAFGDKWVRYLDVTVGQVYLLYISNWSQSGLAFNLDWNLQGGASLDCTVLRADLLDLRAGNLPEAIAVEWTMPHGNPVERFVVERAWTGGTFTEIGSVAADHGTMSEERYRFLDASPMQGVNWYRLRLHDAQGGTAHSAEVAVHRMRMSADFAIHPNPFSDQGWLIFSSLTEGVADLHLYSTDGRVLRAWQHPVLDGANRLNLLVQGLSEGTYPLRLSLPDGTCLHQRLTISR